ncbi:hypothetical protein PTRA_a2216 [Pseudoalteromonas translucida KMM 520]|uniref:Carrier domain-containing protein n=1 Tax=Pseudoalteromonas translucida KMM 520 TaxID=1315283 RepID=A0A0U2X025_9GAMM|nr:AMP-binding protein [Pseudoalteromonas translucida]ALS33329.1 hypothetical protein PTRA_a2216 [Pseudoalteromonas translucida KMM 520]
MFKDTNKLTSKLRSNSIAAVESDQKITYSLLIEKAEGIASKLGSQRSLILLECTPSIDWLISYVAILLGKHVALMLPPNNEEMASRLGEAFDANFIIKTTNGIDVEKLSSKKVNLHEDLCLLLSTSGSTGSPKCVKLSYDNIEANTVSIIEYLGIDKQDIGIVNLPTNYSYGLSIVNTHLFCGATIGFNTHAIYTKEFWNFCKEQNATSFAGVPHNFDLLSKINYQQLIPSSIKYFTQAGGKLATNIVSEFASFAKARGCKFFVMYGQTEASPRMSYLPPDMCESNPNSIGIPIPRGEFKVVDDKNKELPPGEQGELIYNGPNVMMGYAIEKDDLKKDKETFELKTGDIAKKSLDGLYFVTGRMSRFIKVFGNRISLDQIEVMCNEQHFDAICTGVDEKLLIVTRQESKINHINEYFQQHLKLPKSSIKVVFKKEFPTLDTGKFDYNSIKMELTQSNKKNNEQSALSINDTYISIFGELAKNKSYSFFDLGGDSLTFFSISIELEEKLGYLPENWTNISIAGLESLPKKLINNSNTKSTSFKNLVNLDSLRAFACILVVAFHVFGSEPHYGLGYAMDSPWRSIFDVFDLIRIPLFTALAGIVFIAILSSENKIFQFLFCKITSLLLPAVVVSILYFLLRNIIGKEDGDLGTYLISGYLHLWYLYSLFVIATVIGTIHLRFRPSFYTYIISMILLYALSLTISGHVLFWVYASVELAPYFILGMLLYKHPHKFLNKTILTIAAILALLGTCLRVASFFEIVNRDLILVYFTFITSISLIIISYFFFPKIKVIQWIGLYSYSIYLWHPAAASTARTILTTIGIDNHFLLFLVLLIAGILIPVVMYKAAKFLPRLIRMSLVGR